MTLSNFCKSSGIQTLLEFSSSSLLITSFVWSTWPTLAFPFSPSLSSRAQLVKSPSKTQWSTSLFSPTPCLCCKTMVMYSKCRWFPRQRSRQLLVCTHLPRITMVAMPFHCWYYPPIHPPWSSPMATGCCITACIWTVVRYVSMTSNWTAEWYKCQSQYFFIVVRNHTILFSDGVYVFNKLSHLYAGGPLKTILSSLLEYLCLSC